MLYVSRFIGYNCVGVVDTDDDFEETVTMYELNQAVVKTGLDIVGVNPSESIGGNKLVTDEGVTPYQPPETYTRLQVKAKTLLDTEIVVHKGIISRIFFGPDSWNREITLRLSDYGRECGDFMLCGNIHSGRPKVLQLDDQITFTDRTFALKYFSKAFVDMGIVVDLSDMSDQYAARAYNILGLTNDDEFFKNIIDKRPRFHKMFNESYQDWLKRNS